MNRFSTVDMIEHLGEQVSCSDSDIVRLIHIYYANYIADGNPSHKLSMSEMKDIYRACQSLMANFQAFSQSALKNSSANNKPSPEYIKKKFREQLPPHLRLLWDSLVTVRYQMRMLGDVGATLLFVSDIVNRTLEKTGDRFLGVDLGTGTGILLAAQDILARKLGYNQRDLHGIEYSPEVAHKTAHFSEGLGYNIHRADTTSERTWDMIPKGHMSFISNENVPAANERMHSEPFFANMLILHKKRHRDISKKTGFSPIKLEVIKDPETVDHPVTYQATPENRFCSSIIENTRYAFLNNGLGDFLSLLIPDTITLEGKDIPLQLVSKIGAERLGNFGYKRGFMSRF